MMPSAARSPEARAHLMVFAGAFCISFAALFVKGAPMHPSMIAFYRCLFGAIALFAVALVRRERLLPSAGLLAVMAPAGFLFSADLISWHESIVRIGPGLATIICNFQVFFMAAYGAFFLKERLSLRHCIAMPLAVLGLAMLLEVNPAHMPASMAAGVAFGLISAVFYTGYILTVRQSQMRCDQLPPVANMAWITSLAALGIALFCLPTSVSFTIPDLRSCLILAALGILCQATGWVLFSLALPHLPPSRAGLLMLAQPALSFAWDILFYSRPTGLAGYLGASAAIFAIRLGLAPTKKTAPLPDHTA